MWYTCYAESAGGKNMKIAYFVKRPRIKEDLMRPHLAEQERPYEIAKTIMLSAIDYENFTTDMLADRDYLHQRTVTERWLFLLLGMTLRNR